MPYVRSTPPGGDRPSSPGVGGDVPLASIWPEAGEWSEDSASDREASEDSTAVGSDGEARRRAVRRHREVLAVCGVVALLALLLVEVPDGRVAVRGLTDHPLPQSCMTRSLLGIKCPGCGLTRSIIHLAEGDWRASWRNHRLGALMAAVLLFQVPYRLLALRRPETPLIPPRWQAALGIALIVLLFANWLADVVAGRLAPL